MYAVTEAFAFLANLARKGGCVWIYSNYNFIDVCDYSRAAGNNKNSSYAKVPPFRPNRRIIDVISSQTSTAIRLYRSRSYRSEIAFESRALVNFSGAVRETSEDTFNVLNTKEPNQELN